MGLGREADRTAAHERRTKGVRLSVKGQLRGGHTQKAPAGKFSHQDQSSADLPVHR